jgi:hypothetical protein
METTETGHDQRDAELSVRKFNAGLIALLKSGAFLQVSASTFPSQAVPLRPLKHLDHPRWFT